MRFAPQGLNQPAKSQIRVPQINKDLCRGCGVCVEICPRHAISMENNIAQINGDDCIGCGVCEDYCPTGAICVHNGEGRAKEQIVGVEQ
ncbi:MAG: 4Fe-4S binding protein [Candidatus Omnitrophica bacterium]|nr:4Fe-4S binding protein [Candidatus Omnitrophota bacterium]